MGALCGKESSSDPFSQPGRTLSSAPAPQTISSVLAQRKVGGPPRALGGSSNPITSSENDAGSKAADAAVKRDQESKKVTGPLGRNVLQTRATPNSKYLKDRSEENQLHRTVDKARGDTFAN